MTVSKLKLNVRYISEYLCVVKIDREDGSRIPGDPYGTGMYLKGLLLNMLKNLQIQHLNYYLDDLGHPVPVMAIELSKRLGVEVGAVRSGIARLRKKGVPINNIHGYGFYLDIPKQ